MRSLGILIKMFKELKQNGSPSNRDLEGSFKSFLLLDLALLSTVGDSFKTSPPSPGHCPPEYIVWDLVGVLHFI